MRIKTCPHCSGTARLNASYSYKTRCYFIYVRCDICGAQGKIYRSDEDPDEENWNSEACNTAIAAWNMRDGVTDD